jgi:polysaccharide pyruvyl transferase WcaK-like protein
MKILVTGLCLSRNLGGPAMGLTLINQLKSRYPKANFIFAIEPHEYDFEKKWAEVYNIEIVRRDKLTSYLTTKFRLREIKSILKLNFKKHKNTILFEKVNNEFFKAIKESDLIIDMSGIAYVGDGVRGPLEGIRQYSNFYFAKKFGKPFARFIQSFGPFNDFRVRFFAKRELNRLDFVPARGKNSAGYCKEIVKDKSKVYDFPDSAILLPPADDEWTNQYLSKIGFRTKDYIIISPSSVIYNIPKHIGGSIGENHIESMYLLTHKLLSKNFNILFLPHMYSPTKNDCDREICYNIYHKLNLDPSQKSKIKIVHEDIDPMQAKGLIKHSKLAIVSRYHALVAAVSMSVPVITLGWNIKYKDLLDYYDLGEMAIDVRKYNPTEIYSMIVKNQKNKEKVLNAFELLYNWINKNYVAN